jgi:hypothetical protein
MKTNNLVDTAKLSLLLNELRLPAMKSPSRRLQRPTPISTPISTTARPWANRSKCEASRQKRCEMRTPARLRT